MAYETEHQREDGGHAQDGHAPEAGVDVSELVRAAADFARENPHAALGAALALGFVVGGGLTPRLLASFAVHAGRRYLADAARQAMESAVEGEIAGARKDAA